MSALVLVLGAWLAGGIGELALDRGALTELLAAAVPPPRALGPVTLEASRPEPVRFVDGGVESALTLRIVEFDWSSVVELRYEPAVRAEDGLVHLAPVRVQPRLPLPVELDLVAWAPQIELPRRLGWELPLVGGRRIEVLCYVQGIVIDEERLRVELGLVTQP